MAEKGKLNMKQLEAMYAKEKQMAELKISLLEQERNEIGNILDQKRRIALEEEISNEKQKIANAMLDSYNNALEEGYVIHGRTNNAFRDKLKLQQSQINNQKIIIRNKETMLKLQNGIKGAVKFTYNYLMESDKIIKSTILNLGLSGAKAEAMRTSFESSAGLVARLGGNLEDVQSIMQVYANETGRARALSGQMVEDIYVIGKGTGLGVENATRLAGQFELMGVNAKGAMDYAQGVVETSELMGVNSAKVMKNISDNFGDLQKMTFVNGVKGFAKMAEYAEKFHIDMKAAIDSSATARSLEGAVEMTAKLQMLGGQFASADPFKMLYESRNAPEEYQKSLNNLTRGIATFRKNADGSFESFISPADIDRLRVAEESLGLSSGELVKQARRMNEIQVMRQKMIGLGLSDRDKTLIEGMATFESKTGKFSVQVAGISKDIHNLSAEDLKILDRRSKSLEDRAEAAQTFDEVFKSTINELKANLLPLVRGVNEVLLFIRPYVKDFSEGVKEMSQSKAGWLKIAGILMGAGILWKIASFGMMKATGGLSALMNKTKAGRVANNILGSKKGPAGVAKGGGGMLKAGAGIGAAGLGVGAGIGLAAVGISELADAMSKLTPKQAETLNSIVMTLGVSVGITTLAAAGIIVFGKATEFAAPGLGAFALAALGVGAAIGIAGAGIGAAAYGLSMLVKESKDAGDAMLKVGGGMAAMGAGMALLGPASIFGLPAFALTLKQITKHAPELEKVGSAFSNIKSVISASDGDLEKVKNAIIAISNADLSNLNALKSIGNVFSKPLKVEFTDKEVAVVSNVTLMMDGYKFAENLGLTEYVAVKSKEQLSGNLGNIGGNRG